MENLLPYPAFAQARPAGTAIETKSNAVTVLVCLREAHAQSVLSRASGNAIKDGGFG
jgi:hypothetical protein